MWNNVIDVKYCCCSKLGFVFSEDLRYILKKKIRRLSDEKKIRFQLYKEIKVIIDKLEQLKLINDSIYAESKINALLNQVKSKNYIRQYLIRKGISSELANKQISLFYEKNQNLEKESALKFAKKKNLLNDHIAYEKKLSKMARAGFSYEISKEILK